MIFPESFSQQSFAIKNKLSQIYPVGKGTISTDAQQNQT